MIDIITPDEIIDRDVAVALRDRWAGILTKLRLTGEGRMRIDAHWETLEEAEHRLQQIVDHHSRTIKLIEGFRSKFAATDQ